jgi:hypothetical protein
VSKYDQLVNKLLGESYFGGSPYNRSSGLKTHIDEAEDDGEFLTPDEVKAIQQSIPKKPSALQRVDKNQLSPAGREFFAKIEHAVDMYQQGSKIGGDAELRTSQMEFEDQALQDTFGNTQLDYVGWDRGVDRGAHLFRYPNVAGDDHPAAGVPYDKDGFRIEAQMKEAKDADIPELINLYPLDQFDVVNFFARGSDDPFLTKGKIVRG